MVCSRAHGGKTALLGWKSSVPRRIVLGIDANVLIYALEGNPEFGPDAKHVLRDSVENTGCSASELIIMELMARKMNETTAARLYTWLQKVGIRYQVVTREVLLKAADLRRSYDFGAMDSIHVASAMQAGCTHFVTNDRQVLRRKVPGIHIVSLSAAAKLL